jgi:hypothetical protein
MPNQSKKSITLVKLILCDRAILVLFRRTDEQTAVEKRPEEGTTLYLMHNCTLASCAVS